jgi:Caudovirus prohead serine protease
MTVPFEEYERRSRVRDFRDRKRGYSIMGAAGPITHVDDRPVKPSYKRAGVPQILEGFACLYGVPHQYKGRTEIFERNCFAGSLYDVMFGIDHRYEQKKLGDQNDGSLELVDTDVGLAFRLKLEPGHLERLDGRDEVSVAYIEHDVIVRAGVRVIRKASIFEVSAVHVGAMRTTHAVVRDANKVGTLADDAKHGFASESAATAFMRALNRPAASLNRKNEHYVFFLCRFPTHERCRS